MQSQQQIVSHGVQIRCPNTRCAYKWTYKGRFSIYATCPSCRYNVKIDENKIGNSLQSPQLSRARETGANTPGVEPRRR
jgi:hypothetical protein